AVTIIVRLGAGALVDADRISAAHQVVWLMSAGALGFGLLGLGPTGVWPGTVLAFGAGWGWTGLYALAAVRSSPGAPGAASAMTTAGLAGGAAVGPVLFG